MTDWTIRVEGPADEEAITEVVARAFETMAFSDGSEAALVGRLRRQGDLILSLVAEDDDEIVGHVGFNPITVAGRDVGWFQLSPLSVIPERQRQGIGGALILAGIAAMRSRGARGIGVEGDPNYYERFGFSWVEGLGPAGPHAKFYRSLVLSGKAPVGEVRYATAFY